MKKLNTLITASLACILLACDSKPEESKEVKGVIPEYQLKALEDAKAVQKKAKHAAEEQKKAMDEINRN